MILEFGLSLFLATHACAHILVWVLNVRTSEILITVPYAYILLMCYCQG